MGAVLRAVTTILMAALALGLAGVAASGPGAAKQRVAITTQAARATPVSPFVLTPLQAGAVKRDSGTATAGPAPERVVMREGQSVTIYDQVVTLAGKRGSLTIRYRSEWVEAGNGYQVSSDTWKVVRGTGQYAQITGGGRGGSVNLDRGSWSSRAEGFLTLRKGA